MLVLRDPKRRRTLSRGEGLSSGEDERVVGSMWYVVVLEGDTVMVALDKGYG